MSSHHTEPHSQPPSTSTRTIEISFNPSDSPHGSRSGTFQLNEGGKLHLPTIARYFSIQASGLMLNGMVPAADTLTGLTLHSYLNKDSTPSATPLIASGPSIEPQHWPATLPSSSPPPQLKVLLVLQPQPNVDSDHLLVEPSSKRSKTSEGAGAGNDAGRPINLGLWTPPLASLSPSSLQHLQSRLNELVEAKQREGGGGFGGIIFPRVTSGGYQSTLPPSSSSSSSSWSLSYPFYGESLPLSTSEQLNEALDHFSSLVSSQGMSAAIQQCRIYCRPILGATDGTDAADDGKGSKSMDLDDPQTLPSSSTQPPQDNIHPPPHPPPFSYPFQPTLKTEPQLDLSRHLAHLPVASQSIAIVKEEPITVDQSMASEGDKSSLVLSRGDLTGSTIGLNKIASDPSLSAGSALGSGVSKGQALPPNASAAAANFLVQLLLHQKRQKNQQQLKNESQVQGRAVTLNGTASTSIAVKAESKDAVGVEDGAKKDSSYSAKTRHPDGRFKDPSRHASKIEDMQGRIDGLFEGSIRGLVTVMDHKRFLCKACQSSLPHLQGSSASCHLPPSAASASASGGKELGGHNSMAGGGGGGGGGAGLSVGGPTVITAYSAYHIDAVRKHFLRHHEDLLTSAGVNLESWRKGYELKGTLKHSASQPSLPAAQRLSHHASAPSLLQHSFDPHLGQGQVQGGDGSGGPASSSFLAASSSFVHYYPPTFAPNPLDQLYLSSYLPSSSAASAHGDHSDLSFLPHLIDQVLLNSYAPSHKTQPFMMSHPIPTTTQTHFSQQVPPGLPTSSSYPLNFGSYDNGSRALLDADEEMELMCWLAQEEAHEMVGPSSVSGSGAGSGAGGYDRQGGEPLMGSLQHDPDPLPGLFDRLHTRACETQVPRPPPPPALQPMVSAQEGSGLQLNASILPVADDQTLDLVSQLYFSSYASHTTSNIRHGGSGSDLLGLNLPSIGSGSFPANTLIDEIYRSSKYKVGAGATAGGAGEGSKRQREDDKGERLLMDDAMDEDSNLLI